MNQSYIHRLSERFVAEPQSVPAARHAAESVRGVLGSRVCERVCLLVSELVTDAVLHPGRLAARGVGMRVWTSPTSVRVAVSKQDPDAAPTTAPSRGELAMGGWALYLVERIADRWGQRAATEVWFEIDT